MISVILPIRIIYCSLWNKLFSFRFISDIEQDWYINRGQEVALEHYMNAVLDIDKEATNVP